MLHAIKDKEYRRMLFSLSIPIIIQNLFSQSLNLVDNILVGRIGTSELVAISVANQIFFVFLIIMSSFNTAEAVLIAQFWGKKDIKDIQNTLGVCLQIGLVLSLLFFIPTFLFPNEIMRLFTNDTQSITLGAEYFRIVSFSYLFSAVTFVYASASKSIEKTIFPMWASVIALSLNTVLGYVLIYGKFGLPKLGLEGAAIATVVARLTEMLIIIACLYFTKSVLANPAHRILHFSKTLLKRIFKIMIPIISGDALWVFAITTYLAIYTRVGVNEAAAVQIATTIQNVFLIVFFGIGTACEVMVGKNIGAKDYDKAMFLAKENIKLTIIVAMISGIVLILTAGQIVDLFKPQVLVYDYSVRILAVMGLFLFIKMYNMVVFNGVIKAGGDTSFSFWVSATTIWFIGIPLALVGAFVFKLPIHLVVLLAHFEELVKALITIPRFLSKKWIHNLVSDISENE